MIRTSSGIENVPLVSFQRCSDDSRGIKTASLALPRAHYPLCLHGANKLFAELLLRRNCCRVSAEFSKMTMEKTRGIGNALNAAARLG